MGARSNFVVSRNFLPLSIVNIISIVTSSYNAFILLRGGLFYYVPVAECACVCCSITLFSGL